jgi:uncharacterized protein
MQRDKLIIFVKAPRPREVKTRLAEGIGPEAACEAYCELVDRVLDQVSSFRDVELRFAPDDAVKEVKPWLRANWTATAQGRGHLGERLTRTFADAFAEGCARVVAIGSDCPDLTARDVMEAWNALETQEVVVGPASDGGYWLIGLNAQCDRIFEQIDWSTARVFDQTMERVKASGKSYHLLRQLTDVDTEYDWKAYRKKMTNDEAPMTKG